MGFLGKKNSPVFAELLLGLPDKTREALTRKGGLYRKYKGMWTLLTRLGRPPDFGRKNGNCEQIMVNFRTKTRKEGQTTSMSDLGTKSHVSARLNPGPG